MPAYVDFVQDLIYGGGLAPNHVDWVNANPTPGGLAWLEHHVDAMLPAYEAWLVAEGLPPVTPWDGVRRAPWDPTQDNPLPPAFDTLAFASLADLGVALRDRFGSVSSELNGVTKAPFSYRYWSYMKWCWQTRRRYLGESVFPVGTVYDRDGTILSATPFCDAYNDMHRSWHNEAPGTGALTPGFTSTAGQKIGRGIPGMSSTEEFLRFHREHMELIHRWLARTGQPPLRPIDMGRPGGWPPTSPEPVAPPNPWAFDEAAVAALAPGAGLRGLTSISSVGNIEFSYHVNGHGANTDIGPLSYNNYNLRFHNWHGWIDSQWWWREPRFAWSDPATGERQRVFRPVQQDGSDFPGLSAVSIVRDPSAAADTLWPPAALGGVDLATGAGTLRWKTRARDPWGRALRLRLVAEVLDAAGAVVPALTVTVDRTIGPGGDHPLDSEFTEDLTFAAGAFLSDDPAPVDRANTAVGFVHARIRVTGRLWVPNPATPDDPATSPDAGFVHADSATLDLVREKQAPTALIYQDLSSFSEDQVNATMVGDVATFPNAFFLVTQDRTSPAVPEPAWPAPTVDAIKGLVVGFAPAAGLFDDLAHQPEVVLWQETVDAPFPDVTVELLGSPDKEDPTLAPDRPQRLTWRYAIVFAAGHGAFEGLAVGAQRLARLQATVRDRAGNRVTVEAQVKLFKDANPYMIDGPTPWLSVDTRVLSLRAGQSKLGETVGAGAPRAYLAAIVGRLNSGTTGVDTFETLATEGPDAALEYATEIPNPSTGASTPVYNFALAKVRLRGSAGAVGVRAFFRLFRYAAPSLLFSETAGYRAFADGLGKIIAVPGFESETAGAPLTSIPFFASSRVNAMTSALSAQDDPDNVHTFPAGPTEDRVWYFGAWLDINDPDARLPASFDAGLPHGPYPLASLQSLRALMRDFHQCMVVEIKYDGDPTEPMATPSSADNLAQRNLVILHSDNPGDRWTRTVEHSFEVDLARPPRQHRHTEERPLVMSAPRGGHEHGQPPCLHCGGETRDVDGCCGHCGAAGACEPLEAGQRLAFTSTFAFRRLVDEEAMSLAMQRPHEHGAAHSHKEAAARFRGEAAGNVGRSFPFVFHPSRWTDTASLVDELLIRWNNLPRGTEAELVLAGIPAESVVNLRNLRHAPGTVRAAGDGVLRLQVVSGGVTYVPVLPAPGGRVPGLLRVTLPEGVRAGQRYTVDVTQLRAGSTVRNGAFRVEIVVGKAPELLPIVTRGLTLLHDQLGGIAQGDLWRPLLQQRLATERRRARSLAAHAGVPFTDPTSYRDQDGAEHPIEGVKVRVVLERIEILDDSEPWWKGRGEVDFHVRVRTDDNGGIERHQRFPARGHFKVRTGQILTLDAVVFEGHARGHLAIRIDAMERDVLDPDDRLGNYVRVLGGPPASWLGRYQAGDEAIDPEMVGAWKVQYRIERG